MTPELEKALVAWNEAKTALDAAKAAEMEARKVAFNAGFGDTPKEGTNKVELDNGYQLKGVYKLNYNIVAPEGEDKIDAVDNVIDEFGKIGNEGSFIADRLFKWAVTLSVSEYRKIEEAAKNGSGEARAMMRQLERVLEIKPASPTLEIIAPKGGK